MANQTFKVAGITTHGTVSKVRFTDDIVRRVKQFTKGGSTRCDLINLPSEMTKVEALKYMQAHVDFAGANDQALISDALVDREKTSGEVKIKTSKKSKPSLDVIKARPKKVIKNITPEQILAQVEVK